MAGAAGRSASASMHFDLINEAWIQRAAAFWSGAISIAVGIPSKRSIYIFCFSIAVGRAEQPVIADDL